jgi:hypothetical protein
MKRFIPLLALFAAGIVVSFAVASPPPGHGKPTTSSSSTTSGPGKSGAHSNAKCRPVNLKGTIPSGTIALNVTKAAGANGQHLAGTTANLMAGGKVSVQAWSCSAAGSTAAPTLFLKQLHVGGSPHNFGSTTTTTGP